MNDFVGNTLQTTFYTCWYILLSSGTRPKTDAHIPIRGATMLL